MSAEREDMDDNSLECNTANEKKKKRSRKKKKSVSAQDESADNAVSAANEVEEAGPCEAGLNLSSTGKLTSEEKVEKGEETSESKSLRKKKKKKKRKKSETVSITTPEPPCDGDDDGIKGCEVHRDEECSNEAEMSGGVAANGYPQHGIGEVVSERNSGGLANEKSISAQDENADNAVTAANEIGEAGPSEVGLNLSSTGKLTSEEKVEKGEETLESKSLRKKKKKKKRKKSETVSISTPEPPCDGDDDGIKGCEVQSDKERSSEAEMSGAVGKVVSERNSGGLANEVDEKKPKEDGNTAVIDSEVDSHGESDSNLKPSLADDTDITVRGKEDLCESEEDNTSCSSELAPEVANVEFANSDDATAGNPGEALCSKPILEDHESDEEDNSFSSFDHEGRNILCIFKLIYGVGLQAIRKLFKEMNPTWTNQPSDAAAFDRGKMKLNKEEENVFNSGDIEKWDFSLITTALCFSKTCALEMSKRADCDDALKELKKIRNKLLGHPSTDRMCDADFNIYWPQLSSHFVTLGANPADIADIKNQSDGELLAGEYYKDRFLEEKAKSDSHGKKLDSIEKKLDDFLVKLDPPCKTPVSPKDLGGPNWDEWLKFCAAVGDFDTRKNQYILVTDALSQENLDCFSVLRSVQWKMVLDFDPMSEEKGFYHQFTSHEGQGSLISMATPAELKPKTIVTLAREIDSSKTQWLFVNGRSSDTGGKQPEFAEWEATSVKEISRFFVCCCDPDKFDKQKPVVCLILPFFQKTVPYLERTLGRLFENFADQFRLHVVSFKNARQLSVFEKVKVCTIDLASDLVHLGLKQMLCLSSSQQYRMPTSQAQIYAQLSNKEYLYLKEFLEVLYIGCEELPDPNNSSEGDKYLQEFLEENRRLFFSGNAISFASLYYNHDAKRDIENDIKIHVQRLLADKTRTRSVIVEIKHSPGTGGTTIARRVMWDLHKDYPCAFIEVNAHLYYDEDNIYAVKLAEHIAALEEICRTSPVILIDGKQPRAIEVLSNKLVRMLGNKGKRALLLRCLHGSKTSAQDTRETCSIHKIFYVDVKLEDTRADLNEFQQKYNELIEKSLGEARRSGPCRVFHFPLLAMMDKFRPRLKKIIDDSWNEMESLQQDIAVVVAFLQKYANQPTPALLLYDAFSRHLHSVKDRNNVTYEEIKQLFTEHLLNLMIPLNPLRCRGGKYHFQEASPERYTLQHRVVAELLLKKAFQTQGCDLFQVVNQFLHFPVYQREVFMPLFEDLFVYNKDGQKKRKFSLLFEELKIINQERAAEVFCEAAEKTGDSVVYANAARFFAKMDPPSFSKAMELIEQAFKTTNAKLRFRSICHTKGVVLYVELQYMIYTGRVENLQKLEDLATKVLDAYSEARNFPLTYPNPLIGEVDVWLACIGWIMKHKCNRDADKTLRFLTNQCPEFFRSCVSHSFYLLDTVDRIVQSVPSLPDPEDTQRRCNNARVALMKNFGTRLSSTGRGRDVEDVVQACQALCSAKNFPRSSALELKRLQALFILNSSDPIDKLKQEHLVFLQKLLGDLVFKENENRLAYHLMKVCILVNGPQTYTLVQGFALTEKWSEVSRHDSLPYFYQMAICFLQILDGNAIEFLPKYLKACASCREKSQNHCRSTQSTLFVSKNGQGMSRLLTRNTLFSEETDYPTEVPEMVYRFWQVESRRKLLECKGRIRSGTPSDRGKSYPYIELVPGKVELYLPKNAGIGRVDRDFTAGQLVYFVTSFTLQGPVANGITYEPQNKTSS